MYTIRKATTNGHGDHSRTETITPANSKIERILVIGQMFVPVIWSVGGFEDRIDLFDGSIVRALHTRDTAELPLSVMLKASIPAVPRGVTRDR